MPGDTIRVPIPDRPEVRAFLAAIKEEPDDLTARLILADWLEEHDDPRGIFLRHQCHSTGKQGGRYDHEMDAIRRRHEAVWLGGLAGHLDGWQFDRGLLRVTLAAAKLPPPEMSPAPIRGVLRTVRHLFELMTGRAEGLEQEAMLELAGTETWAWVETVSLRDADPQQLGDLLRSPLLQSVHCLDLTSSDLGDPGAMALAASPHAAHLRVLRLDLCGIGVAGIRALAESPHLAGLRELYLGYNNAEDEGAVALARSPHLRQLRVLSLERNLIGCVGAEALATAPWLSRLRTLNLALNLIGSEGAAALASSPHLGGLSRLVLHENPLGSDGRSLLLTRFGDTLLGVEERQLDGGTEIEL